MDAGDLRLGRLLQHYLHEWSAKLLVPIGVDALFTYEDLALYADRTTRRAYLFLQAADEVPVGFALVLRDETGRSHLEEFFVIFGVRRRGVGAAAARRVFAELPGAWTLTVRPENPEGLGFWRRVLAGADETVEQGDDGIARTRFSWHATV